MIDFNAHAFSECIFKQASGICFNMFGMLAVDLMHEVELGVWKAVFIHLLRVLDCQNESLKYELDRRQASFEASEGLVLIFRLGSRNTSFRG